MPRIEHKHSWCWSLHSWPKCCPVNATLARVTMLMSHNVDFIRSSQTLFSFSSRTKQLQRCTRVLIHTQDFWAALLEFKPQVHLLPSSWNYRLCNFTHRVYPHQLQAQTAPSWVRVLHSLCTTLVILLTLANKSHKNHSEFFWANKHAPCFPVIVSYIN